MEIKLLMEQLFYIDFKKDYYISVIIFFKYIFLNMIIKLMFLEYFSFKY